MTLHASLPNSTVDLESMRKSGKILAATLELACKEWLGIGLTPFAAAKRAEEFITSHEGARPAFLNYRGFPAAACISVNAEAVHGIPSTRTLVEGDIVSFDCGVVYNGHYTDACRTIALGEVPDRTKRLIKATKEALDKGIAAVKSGGFVGDISYAVQKHIERKGFSVSLDFVGHGIGRELHMLPCIPNYGPPAQGPLLLEGTCLAIEPVIFDGPTNTCKSSDGWTLYSPEGILSSHFEDTVIVTSAGAEVVTRLVGG